MNKKLILALAVVAAIGGVGTGAYLLEDKGSVSAGHVEDGDHVDTEHHGEEAEEAHGDSGGHEDTEHHKPGPNGGQLFSQGDIEAELVAPESEDGSKPMSLYLSQAGRPISPNENTRVAMEIVRPSGEVRMLPFRPQGNVFVSSAGIAEPHFFEATLLIERAGETYKFAFAKEEGLIELSNEQIEAAGIQLAKSVPGTMNSLINLPGEIRFDEDRTAHVVPRLGGVVESVEVNLGQTVKKGQLLAVIASQQISELRSEFAAAQRRAELARTTFERERQLWKERISAEQDYLLARQTLQEADIALKNARQKVNALGGDAALSGGNRYELRAPFDGVVVEKHLVLGEVVSESSSAFTISDLSRVWATFAISPRDLGKVQVGKAVTISAPELQAEVAGTVSYVGNLLGEQTRTATARATLENPEGAWRPGLFVSVALTANSNQAAVTVPSEAIQSIEEKPTVFVRVDEGFVAQPVSLGARSDGFVEITQGLSAGALVAAEGSFVIKSELGKGSADHAH